jgi:glyoxylase-like metal-dependent hydrolase (beta-lactamase superfamily II)
MVNVKLFVVNENETNSILIWDETNQGLLIDPGFCSKEEFYIFSDFVQKNNISISNIVLTHGHYDHVAGVKISVQLFSVRVYLHKLEEGNACEGLEICKLKKWELCSDDNMFDYDDVSTMQEIIVGKQTFRILHTPGHSTGSICLYSPDNKLLISGDTLLYHNYGRTDFDDGDYNSLLNSFSKLLDLPKETYVLPGHGKPTTIGEEFVNNPLIKRPNIFETITTTEGITLSFDKTTSVNTHFWKEVKISTDRKFALYIANDSKTTNRAKELFALKNLILKDNPTIVNSIGLPLDIIDNKVLFSTIPTCLYFENGKFNGHEKIAKWFCSAKILNRYLPESYLSQPIKKVFVVCKILAECIEALHKQSVYFNSLSYNDFMVDINTMTLRIVNSFDNCVLPNSELNYDWCPSLDFMAPESVSKRNQGINSSSIESNRHALAVCIYMLLFKRHPLRGSKINDIDPAKDEEMSLGKNALFIENPFDTANKLLQKDIDKYSLPQCDCDKYPYTMYGDRITQLFTRAFVDGLHDPVKRPTASEWIIALNKKIEEF